MNRANIIQHINAALIPLCWIFCQHSSQNLIETSRHAGRNGMRLFAHDPACSPEIGFLTKRMAAQQRLIEHNAHGKDVERSSGGLPISTSGAMYPGVPPITSLVSSRLSLV